MSNRIDRRSNDTAANGEAGSAVPATGRQAGATPLPPLLIDLQQLAQLLSVSPRSCKRLAAESLPPGAVVRIGRRRLFNRLVIERWVSQGCPPPRGRR